MADPQQYKPMKQVGSALCAALLAVVGASAGEMAPLERVLPNLCSGPPADPLPQLGANHPAAAEMAAIPRRHPYLFFDATSIRALRDRDRVEPYRGLAERLRTHAEECLRRPIPAMVRSAAGIEEYLPNGSFNPEFLRIAYDDFYNQSELLKEILPTLGFAYQLTGDRRFGEAGRTWLLNFAARKRLSKPERATDFAVAEVMFGFALGYDWLQEV